MVDVGPKGLREAAAQRAEKTRGELLRLQDAVTQHLGDSALLRRRLGEAWDRLGALLLPDLDRDRLDRLSVDLGVQALAADTIYEALDRDRAELDRTLQEIDAEQARRGDRAELIARIHELEAAMAPHAANVEAFEREPTWPELFDLGYGTPRYNVPWWMFRHYRHRRQAAALVASLGPSFEASTVAELRERFLHERESRSRLAHQWEACTVRKAGLDNLEHGRRVATTSRDAIITRHLSAARRLLVQHLRTGPTEALPDRLAGLPAAENAALRIAGLDAQHDVLSEVFQRWVERPRKDLVDLLNRDEGALVELSDPEIERSMPFEEFVDTYRELEPAWLARTSRYRQLRERILEFDAYGEHGPGTSWRAQILGESPAPA